MHAQGGYFLYNNGLYGKVPPVERGTSLLAEVSHDEAKIASSWETSASREGVPFLGFKYMKG